MRREFYSEEELINGAVDACQNSGFKGLLIVRNPGDNRVGRLRRRFIQRTNGRFDVQSVTPEEYERGRLNNHHTLLMHQITYSNTPH